MWFELLGQITESDTIAAGTSIREIVGEDPVEFAEEFFRNYSKDSWISRERKRLTEAIARAEEERPR